MNIKIPQCKKIYNSIDTKTQKQLKRYTNKCFRNHNANLQKPIPAEQVLTILKKPEPVQKTPSVVIVEDVMTIGGYGSINFLL